MFKNVNLKDTPEKNSKIAPEKNVDEVPMWDRLTDNKKSCIIFTILFTILIIGIGGIITSSNLLGLGVPTRSKNTFLAKNYINIISISIKRFTD